MDGYNSIFCTLVLAPIYVILSMYFGFYMMSKCGGRLQREGKSIAGARASCHYISVAIM